VIMEIVERRIIDRCGTVGREVDNLCHELILELKARKSTANIFVNRDPSW
jgi:hypothetical protein